MALSSSAGAQTRDEYPRHATVTLGASFGDGKTAPATTLGLTFWPAPRLGLEVELAHARKLDFSLDVCPAPLSCEQHGSIPVTGRTVSLVPQLAVRLLPMSRRLQLYVQGGVGTGHVRQRYLFGPPFSSTSAERTRSNLTLAFAFGGGAMVRISRRLAVGGDVRSLHLLDDPPAPERFITPADALSTLRVGSRVSWRF